MITLRAHGNGQARVWAGAFGYEWTVHVIASKDQAGLAIAFRIGVQLEVGSTSIDLGPVTTTSVVQLHPHDDSAFGWQIGRAHV